MLAKQVAASLLVLGASVGLAQGKPPGGGGMPPGMDPAMIKERVKQAVAQLVASAPEDVIEIKGLAKITYKKVPTDPKKVAEVLGQQMGGAAPAGVDVDGLLKQYEPMVAELLNENMKDIGKIEVTSPIKCKSKTIPVGEWRIGLAFEGEAVSDLLISGEKLPKGKPIPLHLKTKAVDLQKELVIEVKEPKKQKEGAETYKLQVSFFRTQARTASKLERGKAAAGEEKAEEKEEKEGDKPAEEGDKPAEGGDKPDGK